MVRHRHHEVASAQGRTGGGGAGRDGTRGPDPGPDRRPGRGGDLAGHGRRRRRAGAAPVRRVGADHAGGRGRPDAGDRGRRLPAAVHRPDQRPAERRHPGRSGPRRPPALVHLLPQGVRETLPGIYAACAGGSKRQAGLGVHATGRLRTAGRPVCGLVRPTAPSDRRGASPAHRAQRPDRPGSGAGPAVRRRARPGAGASAHPATPGAAIAARRGRGSPVPAGRAALVIGDVMGHGLAEAVIMGRLRTAVQTLSDLGLPPDEILGHLNDLVNGLGDDSFATCLYAIYDPVTRICTFARAGHPPPAMVWPDGGVCFDQSANDPPLGVAEPPFEVVELRMPENGLLVLYTDGLIESARVDTDAGMSHLAELLRIHHGEGLDQLCESLTRGLLPAGQSTDDAALLVAQVHATAPDAIATWSLPEDPLAARAARQYVRDQLAAWNLEELAMNTETLASELVANVIRHARGPVQLRLLRSRTLICEVFDGSVTIPRMRRASWSDEGGRGLQLVAALCDRWGTRYMTTGKCIWTEQALPLAAPSGVRPPRPWGPRRRDAPSAAGWTAAARGRTRRSATTAWCAWSG